MVYVYTLHASLCEIYMEKITYPIIPHAQINLLCFCAQIGGQLKQLPSPVPT